MSWIFAPAAAAAAPIPVVPKPLTQLLIEAIRSNSTEEIQRLLDLYPGAALARFVVQRGSRLYTSSLLFEAVMEKKPEIVSYMLDVKHVSPNMKIFEDGLTPLMIAAENRSVDIVRLLLNNGADVSLTDNEGQTVVDYISGGDDADDIDRQMLANIQAQTQAGGRRRQQQQRRRTSKSARRPRKAATLKQRRAAYRTRRPRAPAT